MIEPRSDDGTATVLLDGTVLEVGGPNKSAEIFDPSTGTWTSIGKTHVVHGSHTATLLADGRVLVVGGNWEVGERSVEIYDPTTQAWTDTAPLAEGRWAHSAVLLKDGRVLVVGGARGDGSPIASAEIYDPANKGSWKSAGTLDDAAAYRHVVVLDDGRVLVAGGQDQNNTAFASATVFDPVTETWAAVASMAHARGFGAAVLLDDGNVLVAGGSASGDRLSSAELFDATTLTWSDAGNMTEPRNQLGAVLLADGRALIVGGGQTHNPTAETYDPSSGSWSLTGPMQAWRASPQMALLDDGRAFVLGGFTDDAASTEFFDATTGGPVATNPPWFDRCETGCQGPISAGQFTSHGFISGMSMTVEDGWFDTADYRDELQLERGSQVLRFWKNAGAMSPDGALLEDIPTTPDGLTQWLVNNPNIDTSAPEQTTVGGVPATTLTLTISPENVNVDPECPPDVRSCLRFLSIARGHDFAIGYGEAVRLYLLGIEREGNPETIVVSLDAPNAQELSQLTALVEPILDSLRFP